MMPFDKLQCTLALVVWCYLSIATTNANTVEIFVQNGPVVGERISVLENKALVRFLGIPYAKPPVGELRFRRPQPMSKWQEPVRALNWPPNCVQQLLLPEHYSNQNVSEDCLYLNLWTPRVNVMNDNNLRPVIFLIHDWGLHSGSSSFDLYNGEALALLADALVVSINYRISTMGFFYSDEVTDVKGNQGLWDQVMALKWVNDNIRYFGGNPKAITLMGIGGGSMSVSLHILSPVSRDLFANAIMMSGSALIKTVLDPDHMTNSVLTGIRKVGCATDEDRNVTRQVVDCLQKLEPAKVNEVANLTDEETFDLYPMVVVDGEFLPERPIDLLKKGNHKKNFSLLVSTVEDEASFLLMLNKHQHASFRRDNPKPLTLKDANHFLLKMLTTSILRTKLPNDTITKIYLGTFNENIDKQDLFRKQVSIAFGDAFITCPTLEFAKKVFRNSANSVNVYQWYYTTKMGKDKLLCGPWAGACHLNNLYPVFGIPFRYPKDFHIREREISNQVLRFIHSFIYTGHPGEDQPEWQSYFMANDGMDLVAPYYEIGNEHKTNQNFKFNLKQLECNLIWNRFIETWGDWSY